MGRTPGDFDIATSARPEDVQKIFKKTIPVGAQFGVIMVVKGKVPYEVATFRTDLSYADGRHPEGVVFSTPQEDALRRDFTINGLFFDPIKKKVIDYVGGRQDLRAKIIRAIGDPLARFKEDRLRILRAVRFSAVLGFPIEPATFKAIQKCAKEITEVSSERIHEELIKLFTGPRPGRGLDLLDESGVLDVILPEVARMKGVQQPPEFHPEGDVYVHRKLVLDQLRSPSLVLAFGALLHDVGKPPTFKIADRIRFDGHDRVGEKMTHQICQRLRFSNSQKDSIAELVGNHMRFKDVRQMRMSTLKRFMAMPTFKEQLKLHRMDCLASHGDLNNWSFLKEKLKEFSVKEIKPIPLINGKDLLAAGYSEGPLIGAILKSVEDQQLEGQLNAREDALAWVGKNFPLGSRE